MISYASEKGIRPLLHSNATILPDKYIDPIFESGLDYLSFSFDQKLRQIRESGVLFLVVIKRTETVI